MKLKVKQLSLLMVFLIMLGVIVGCGSNDESEVSEPVGVEEEPTEEIVISDEDFVGTWGEDEEMRLLISSDGTGVWIDVFGEIEWEIIDGEFHILLSDDRSGRFRFELEGDTLFLDSILAEDVEFNYVRLSHEVMEIEEHPLSTSSIEEIQQAVIDVLNEADKEVFREVRSFGDEEDFVSELLGIDEELQNIIFPRMGSGEARMISISVQRLDKIGNDIRRGNDTTEENFSHWDFVHEIDDDGILRIIMRYHFDFEADMSGVTKENFDAIKDGMTLDEVSSLLGSEGTLGATSGTHEVRTWSREFGGGTTVIVSIYFIDNQVTSKAQVGW